MTGPSDAELTALIIARQDTAAFGELVRRYERVVRGMLARMTGDRSTADDLAQDAFIHAFERLHQFRGAGSFRSWLCRIAYTRFIAARRRQGASGRMTDAYGQVHDTETPAPAAAGERLDAERALAILSPDERDAVVLCFACDFSHSEAAEVLGLPLGTVKSHVSRGRAKLQKFLTSHEDMS